MATRAGERVALLALLGSALIASANNIGIRFSNRELAPLWGGSLRFGAAALLLLAAMLLLRLPLPRGRALVGALLYGVLTFGTGFGVFYLVLQHLQAGIGAILLSPVPLVTLLLAVTWRQERAHRSALAGVLLTGVGVILLATGPLRQSIPTTALVALLVVIVSLAQAAVLVRRFPPVHPVPMNVVGMLVAAVVLLGGSVVAGEDRELPRQLDTWLAVGYLVGFGSVALYLLHLLMLRHWAASRVSYVFVLSPVGAVALSAWLEDEPIGFRLVTGGLAVLAGVYFGALRPGRRL